MTSWRKSDKLNKYIYIYSSIQGCEAVCIFGEAQINAAIK